MQTKTDEILAHIARLIDSDDPNGDAIRDAAAKLLDLHRRQTRQLNRLVRLSDATEEKLTLTNNKLAALTENLARFVPQTVVDKLMQSGSEQLVSKDRRQLTVFFSDIVGFTSMTERLEPEQLSTLLVDYFSEMNSLCEKWGGTLDQFIGDAIVIFFGAPESRGSDIDAANALGMALEMQDRLHGLRVKWADLGLRPALHVRMGISTGYATVGNFGSTNRLHYTAIGNTVNEAARIQDLCTADHILIGEDTHLRVRDQYQCTAHSKVQLKGRQNPVQLYEVNLNQKQSEASLVVGSGDGYRIYMDNDAIADKQMAITLLKRALTQLEDNGDATDE